MVQQLLLLLLLLLVLLLLPIAPPLQTPRLPLDHARASAIAAGLRAIPGISAPPRVDTNIVYFSLIGEQEGVGDGAAAGVSFLPVKSFIWIEFIAGGKRD